MTRRRVPVFLAMAAAVSMGLGLLAPGAASAGPAGRHLPAATTAAIDAIVAKNVGPALSPGMAVGVATPQGTYLTAYGTKNLATDAPFSLDDHVRIASITKTFTATVILQMVDRKLIKLDDRLSTYVGGVPNGDIITIRQVLAMSAGIYDYTGDEQFTKDLAADPQLNFSARDLFAILHRHDPPYAPGTKTIYSDSNYYLLTLVAEKVTGKPLGTLVQKWIAGPLGMRDTSYPTTTAMPRPYARGYLPPDGTGPRVEISRVRPGLSEGAGAMISTVGDLMIWSKALAKGTLLSKKTQKERLTFAPLDGVTSPLSIGYGLGTFEIQGFIGHNGAILGYSSVMFYRPDKDTTIVAVGNESTNFTTRTTGVFVDIAELLYPDLFPAS